MIADVSERAGGRRPGECGETDVRLCEDGDLAEVARGRGMLMEGAE